VSVGGQRKGGQRVEEVWAEAGRAEAG
jgi:hypothetical protein